MAQNMRNANFHMPILPYSGLLFRLSFLLVTHFYFTLIKPNSGEEEEYLNGPEEELLGNGVQAPMTDEQIVSLKKYFHKLEIEWQMPSEHIWMEKFKRMSYEGTVFSSEIAPKYVLYCDPILQTNTLIATEINTTLSPTGSRMVRQRNSMEL